MFRALLVFLMIITTTACGGGGANEELPSDTGETPEDVLKPLRLVFLGDSLTSGVKIHPSQTYPALIQKRISELGLPHLVTNSGRSGDTAADALWRLDRDLASPIGVLVLALGTNDAEDGLNAEQAEAALQEIIDRVREGNPDVQVVVAGAYIAKIFSPAMKNSYHQMFQRLAQNNNAVFLDNMLADVEGNWQLNLSDGIHPNADGHKIVAEHFWAVLAPLCGAV